MRIFERLNAELIAKIERLQEEVRKRDEAAVHCGYRVSRSGWCPVLEISKKVSQDSDETQENEGDGEGVE